MGNRSRRELEGQAILRDMLANPPRPRPVAPCELCGAEAVIAAYFWSGIRCFCETHSAEAHRVFEEKSR